jgi:tetratricopeptide (TPR) repeat protein
MRGIVVLSLLLCAPAFAAPLDDARGLIDERRYDEARTILERGVENPILKPRALTMLTLLSNRIEDYENGLRYGKQAVKLSPDSADAHLQYAIAMRNKMAKISKVRAMFSIGAYKKELRTARELEPDNPDARNEEIGFLVTVPGVAGGDVDLAWELALELEKISWRDGLRWQSQIQFMREDDEGGIATLRKILEKDPTSSGTRFQLALRYQSLERFAEADAEFETLQADETDRISMNSLYQRARTRVIGRYEQQQAIDFLQAYMKKLPSDAEGVPGKESAYWRMGNAYDQLGQADEARSAYERSLQIKETKEARESLKSLGKKR